MKKMTARRTAALLLCALLLCAPCAQAIEDGANYTYTYNYDYWVDIRESPDAYRVMTVLSSPSLGLETPMRRPQSLYVRGQDIYICDTGNNRLLHVRRDGYAFSLVRIIDTIVGAEPATLLTPSDVFVDVQNNIYIADTDNNRIIMADENLNFIKQFIKPTDSTFDQSLSYQPTRLVVDVTGRVFALAKNINKGIIKYESDTSFTGFIGANKAKYNFFDYIWKNYFSTKEQRASQVAFVPTEYENIYMDGDGFIYATNTVFETGDLLSDQAHPIRRLNAIGDDILIKNDRYGPVGDLDWNEEGDLFGPSKLTDITVLDNDVYVVFDRMRGHIFGYDAQGVMLWAFGRIGNDDGAFVSPVAIDHMGNDLLALDQVAASLTVFTPTEYGKLIYSALEEYTLGHYDASADVWQDVLKFNANYNMAYRGIGRSLLRQEQYQQAMNYFKMAHDFVNYGESFRLYRKVWVEQNIGWIVIVLIVLVLVPLVIGRVKKIKAEVEEYEHRRR